MPLADAPAILSMLWTPLVVVTAAHGDRRGGQIAVGTLAASIVPEKPRVLVEIQKRNHTHGLIAATGRFAINVLPREQWRLVRLFGFQSQRDGDKFQGVAWRAGPHGLPLLDAAFATLLCRVANAMDGGDITVYLASVEDAHLRPDGAPVQWSEVRAQLPPDWAEEYGRKLAHDIPDSAARMESIDFTPFQPPDA